MLENIKSELDKLATPQKARINSGFFKTKKGEYGEGDIFIGITVPETRKIAKKYTQMKLEQVKKLLSSEIHEYRLAALMILVEKYKKDRKQIFDFYLANTERINNWDLVDLTADKIVGEYLMNREKKSLYQLTRSPNLWERRIAIISTFHFIKNNKFNDTLKIAKVLMHDEQDLIHKAAGWMLREIGKRNLKVEEEFLKQNYKKMPRTMLRYAIEKFDKKKRDLFLKKFLKKCSRRNVITVQNISHFEFLKYAIEFIRWKT